MKQQNNNKQAKILIHSR